MKFTVVTACYNAENELEETIKSVLAQSYSNIEYIIVDGQSEDGTAEILEKYRDAVSLIIREKDSGVFEAMNKGIGAATGEVLFFLNAGDVFYNDRVLEHVADQFSAVETDIIYGEVIIYNPITGYNFLTNHSNVDKRFFYFNTLCHQGVFIKKSLFKQCGLHVQNYKISGDYEWFLRAVFKHRARLHQMDLIISIFKFDGLSSRRELEELHRQERKTIQKSYFKPWETFIFENSLPYKNRTGKLLNLSIYKILRKIFRWNTCRIEISKEFWKQR